jgi:hypothetical protein
MGLAASAVKSVHSGSPATLDRLSRKPEDAAGCSWAPGERRAKRLATGLHEVGVYVVPGNSIPFSIATWPVNWMLAILGLFV